MTWVDPCLQRSRTAAGDVVVRLGVPQLDRYLEFLAARSRPNTVLAVWSVPDLVDTRLRGL